MKSLNSILLSGKEVLPLIEGGKGISITSGDSSGPWALAGGVGTVSAVNADFFDKAGAIIPQIYKGRNRRERHEELVDFSISGGIAQVQRAHELRKGLGSLNINILWPSNRALWSI